jgi:hypothetical protein
MKKQRGRKNDKNEGGWKKDQNKVLEFIIHSS